MIDLRNSNLVNAYTLEESKVVADLDVDVSVGLSSDEAKNRIEKYGENAIEEGKKRTLLMKFLDQFKDFMIIILLVAAAISATLAHEVADAIIILVVVLVNAIFGVYQEGKAEKAIEALKEMSSPEAKTLRNGHVESIISSELVVGDVILLEAGDVVPADLRLLESNSLKIEEASLTGESVPVEKYISVISDIETPIGDRVNMAYQNSNITYGRGMGVVVATGMFTEVGKIATMINAAEETETPLKANLNKVGKLLTITILVIAAIMFVVGLVNGTGFIVMVMTSISLAVAAIPEGLPAIVTIILALGTQVLARRHAIVRKLPAVETLGSTDIICSDKTGTLTLNQMTVEKVYFDGHIHDNVDATVFTPYVLQIMTLNNDSKITADGTLVGDPTETALIDFAKKSSLNIDETQAKYPRVAEVPFDSGRKMMSTIHQMPDGKYLVTVKGGTDEVLARSRNIINQQANNLLTISVDDINKIKDSNKAMASHALRVLATAYRYVDAIPDSLTSEFVEQDLIFAGLIGMIDPERAEARDAVHVAKQAGIRPIMITGDHAETARAIAGRLDIIDPTHTSAVLTGVELDNMSQEEFASRVEEFSVYARVSPEHKVRIVKAWQKKGKVVAMTGDGVNDAPALKTADIGIGMGITGTQVSKGASDLILSDDNFSTIVVAVEEGRKVFANIQKTIQYLLSANLAEVLTLFIATMMSWDTLLPVHLLWINLVTDTLPAIALGVEPAEPGMMNRPPRGKKANFFSNGVLSSVIYQGILQGALTLGVYGIALAYPVHTEPNLMHEDALTMSFVTLGLIQLFHAFNVKSVHGSIFTVGLFKNKTFNFGVLVSFLLLAASAVVPGLDDIFHVSHLASYQWGIAAGASLMIVVVVEIVKAIQRATLKYI